MKVVITTLNSKFIHSSLALRYLKAYGATRNQAYDMVEYTINMPILDIINQITQRKADLIGFACYIWNIDMTLHVAHMLKSIYPQLRIVLGGPEVSYTAEEILAEHPYIDYIVQGEGEEAFADLIGALLEGKDPLEPSIPGILGRRGHDILGSRDVVEVKDLSTIPFPYTEEDMEELDHRIIYYESSRGCPFSCQYCLSGNRNTVRFFPLERVLRELEWFTNHGVKQIKFVDRTFNCAPRHHLPIMDWIIHHGGETNFHLEMESLLIRDAELERLAQVPPGRIQIEVGVQSTHEPTLTAIHRKNDWEHIRQVMTPIIEGHRVHVHMDLIVGLPYEGMKEFEHSFNDLFSLKPQALQIGFLKLLKGSGVRAMKEYQYVANPKAPYEVLATHVLSYEEIRQLKYFEDVFERFYNSEKYRTVFSYISERLSIDGSAFAYFMDMTNQWLTQGLHARKLNDKDQIAFLYDWFLSKGDRVAMDLLRYDVLVTFKGKVKDESFGLRKERKEELQSSEYFWRNESLVDQYIEGYTFSEWRRIRQDYHELLVAEETLQYWNLDFSHTDAQVSSEGVWEYALIVDVVKGMVLCVRPKEIIHE